MTVILVTYNHEPYITQAIESVLGQRTAFTMELLISEDCSTDRTREIVLSHYQRFPELIRLFLSERNLNTNAVTSRAWAAARGEYVAILDGDDWWTSPEKLQRQVAFLDAHTECTFCYHDAIVVHEDGQMKSAGYVPPGMPTFSSFERLLPHNPVPGCAPMIRRRALESLPAWYEHAPFGDWPLYLLAAEHGSAGYIDERLGAYRQHRGGVWSALGNRQQQESLIAFYHFLERHLDRRHRPRIQKARALSRSKLTRVLAREGEYSAAFAEMVRSLHDDLWKTLSNILGEILLLLKHAMARLRLW